MVGLTLALGGLAGLYIGLLIGMASAGPKLADMQERAERQYEYWECLQKQMSEAKNYRRRDDPADWWKRDEDE